MKKRIIFRFERGGVLTGWLCEHWAPETVTALWNSLPLESVLKHSRSCGREVYCQVNTGTIPAKENHTATVSKFDISYWREDWDLATGKSAEDAAETIGFYYGAERLQYSGGILTLNVIGRIDYDQEEMLNQIGQRIWQQGFEKVVVEKL